MLLYIGYNIIPSWSFFQDISSLRPQLSLTDSLVQTKINEIALIKLLDCMRTGHDILLRLWKNYAFTFEPNEVDIRTSTQEFKPLLSNVLSCKNNSHFRILSFFFFPHQVKCHFISDHDGKATKSQLLLFHLSCHLASCFKIIHLV